MPEVEALPSMYRLPNPVSEITARQLYLLVFLILCSRVSLRVLHDFLFHQFLQVEHVNGVFVTKETQNVLCFYESIFIVINIQKCFSNGDPNR